VPIRTHWIGLDIPYQKFEQFDGTMADACLLWQPMGMMRAFH